MNELTINDLLDNVKTYNLEGLKMIEDAYWFADKLHNGQTRKSGEPYIIHPLNVAYILSQFHADTDTICAGLLHDVLEDTKTTKEEIADVFNKDIANLVDGVTKIKRIEFSTKQDQNMANTRKIIISSITDVRVLMIKLADRLHNMRTLENLPVEKQIENAIETSEIYVFLAGFIGNYIIKNELEDLSLKFTYPDKYKRIEEIRNRIDEENKECLYEMLSKIDSILNNKEITHQMRTRTKHIYGIYKKISEGAKISDIHDLLSLKIIVDKISDCYQTLGVVHSIYHPINSRFKDYISNPKTNMYQSLHTTVFGEDDKLVQTQIRTFEMDKIATRGLTAHWDINKNNAHIAMQEDLEKNYQFYKSIVEIDKSFPNNQDFVEQVKKEIFTEKIYVYTPKGEIVELPKYSTAIDLAYKLNPELGNTITSAFVNDSLQAPNCILNNKDRVRINTDIRAYGPHKEWVDTVQTTKARRLILEFNNK